MQKRPAGVTKAKKPKQRPRTPSKTATITSDSDSDGDVKMTADEVRRKFKNFDSVIDVKSDTAQSPR
jgi:hypothetical protein